MKYDYFGPGAPLHGASLRDVDFTDRDLTGADLSHTQLKGDPMIAQVITAHRLAGHYGHEWGHLLESYVKDQAHQADGDAAEFCRLIAEACAARSPDAESWRVGTRAPCFDADGAIAHTTQTGRLEWLVGPDGSAGVLVHRPCDEDKDGYMVASTYVVAVITVSRCGAITNLDIPSDEELGREGARVRHLHALADWMRALGVRLEVLDGYFARAEEYEVDDRLRRMKAALNTILAILGEVTTFKEITFLRTLAERASDTFAERELELEQDEAP